MSRQNRTGQIRRELQRLVKGVSPALISITFIAALQLDAARLQASTVDIYPGNDIPSIVNNNPAGTTFVVHPGIYRLLTGPINAKSGDIFTGQSGALLSGAKLLTSFQHTSQYYYVAGQHQHGRVTIPSA